jgi:hypothetical protein
MPDLPTHPRHHTSWVVAAAAVYALLLGGAHLGRPVALFDEPLLYVGARSVLHGGWPHLDFVSVYPPLYYLPTTWSFALLGETALAARLGQLAAHGLLLTSLLWAFHGAGLRGVRLALGGLAALAFSAALPMDPAIFAVTPSLAALCVYLHASQRRDGHRRWSLLAAAGALGGVALITRVNFGLYTLAALSIDQLASPTREARTPDGLRLWLVRDIAPLALAALLLLLAVPLSYGGHVREIWQQTASSSPIERFSFVLHAAEPLERGVVRLGCHGWWLPILPLAWLALRAADARARLRWWSAALATIAVEVLLAWSAPAALPLVILPGLVAVAALSNRRPLPRRERLALIATALFSHHYLSQPDGPHQLAAALPALLLLPSLLEEQDTLPRDRTSLLAIGAFFVALVLPSIYAARPSPAYLGTAFALVRDGERGRSDAERVAGEAARLAAPLAALYPDPDEQAVARFIQQHSRPDEPVFVGVSNPDGPAVHDLRLSWLIGRPPGTRHYLPISELGNTAAARASILSDLDTRDVAWVVEWQLRPGQDEGANATLSRREQNVQEYIEGLYGVVFTQGDFVVRQRR